MLAFDTAPFTAPPFDPHDEQSVWALFGETMRRLTPSIHASLVARAVREKVPVTVYGIPGGSIIDILQSYDLQEGDIGQHLDTFIVHEDGTIRWYSYNPEEEDIEISAHPNGPYLDLMTSEDQIFEPMYVLVAESLGIDYSVPQRTTAL